MRIQGADGKWYAGPFDTAAEAEAIEPVIEAALAAADKLQGPAGHYELAVNVSPDGQHHVRLRPPEQTFGPRTVVNG